VKIALKEWAVVIQALAEGRQLFLLRKGGIAEGKRGFEPKHNEFLLYPTWEHQHAESLKPEFQELFERLRPRRPGVVSIEYLACVSDVLPAPGIEPMQRMSGLYIWADRYVRMRYDYRPERPLFVLVLRLYRLARAAELTENRLYAGCRSWVPLIEEVDAAGATPLISDEHFAERRNALVNQLSIPSGGGSESGAGRIGAA
jgi:hypothetical protein